MAWAERPIPGRRQSPPASPFPVCALLQGCRREILCLTEMPDRDLRRFIVRPFPLTQTHMQPSGIFSSGCCGVELFLPIVHLNGRNGTIEVSDLIEEGERGSRRDVSLRCPEM